MKTFPTLATDLIRDLVEKYPPRCVGPQETFEDHLRYAGAVDVVTFLLEWRRAADKVGRLEETKPFT